MAAFKSVRGFPFVMLLVVVALLGSVGNVLAQTQNGQSGPFWIQAQTDAIGTTHAHAPSSFPYTLFQGRLVYFSPDGRLFSQLYPSTTTDVVEIYFDDSSFPTDSNYQPVLRVVDGRLMIQVERSAYPGVVRRVYQLDLEGGQPGVARWQQDVGIDAIEHDGYFYGVRTIRADDYASFSCANHREQVDVLTRRDGMLASDLSNDVAFGIGGSCKVITSMKSSPRGLLVSTRNAPPYRPAGGFGSQLQLLNDFVAVPTGTDLSRWTSPRTRVQEFNLGYTPYGITGDPLVIGSRIYFRQQTANYNPYAIGDPSEPAQPVYEWFRHDTATDETLKLDYDIGRDHTVFNGIAYWVANSEGRKALFRFRGDGTPPQAMQLSPNEPADASNEIKLLGVHAGRLVFKADTGNGMDLHYLASDGETATPLYVYPQAMGSATQFRSEGDELVFVWRLPNLSNEGRPLLSFYRVSFADSVDTTNGSGADPNVGSGTGDGQVSLKIDDEPAPSARPGVSIEVGNKVNVRCEFTNNTDTAVTDVAFKLKFQKRSDKNRMRRLKAAGQCGRSVLSPGETVACTHQWKVHPGVRKYVCVVTTGGENASARTKAAITGYAQGN